MKFYELKKGQAFYFVDDKESPKALCLCAGVDGAYGRFVSSWGDVSEPEEWIYCPPTCEVVPE